MSPFSAAARRVAIAKARERLPEPFTDGPNFAETQMERSRLLSKGKKREYEMTLACRRFRFWKRQRNEPTAAGVTIQGKRPKLKSLLSPCATAAPQVDLEANRPWQMLR